jgi:uncharacterized protein DUF748
MASAPALGMRTETFDSHAGPWSSGERRTSGWLRRHRVLVLVVGVIVALAFIAVDAVDEPLRRQLERRVNASLDGYTATIGRADLHPIGFALDLYDVTVVQNAVPNPPMIYIPRWTTSVQWGALLSGGVVADVAFTRPAFYATFPQAATEAKDPKSVTDKGWQRAVEAVYPLEINMFRILDGSLSYFDTGDLPPVVLKSFSVRAENIRNVRSKAGRYPSPIDFDGILADGAHVTLKGDADFLAEPHATVRGDVAVQDLTLAPLAPALRHADVAVKGGKLGGNGRIEYTEKQTIVSLDRLSVASPHIDYVRRGAEQDQAIAKAAKETTTAKDQPETRIDVEQLDVTKGTLGYVDQGASPGYRIALDDVEARIRDFSNERGARRGSAWIGGRVTQPGWGTFNADFAPGSAKPDFRTYVRLEEVDLPALNDFLRAQGGFDVTKGRLSVYSEVTVKNGHIDGYVKPLFHDITVYDWNQDKEKHPLRQLYEATVGAVSTVLTNRNRDDVATITDLSGPVESPNTSTLQIIGNLLRNAFVKAILPGLEPGRRPSGESDENQ